MRADTGDRSGGNATIPGVARSSAPSTDCSVATGPRADRTLANPARRGLLKGSAGLAAWPLMGSSLLAACGGGGGGGEELAAVPAPAPELAPAQSLDPGVVRTANGLLRGVVDNGVSFKGVPYAGGASGTNRFKPPTPVQDWTGIRDAVAFGARSIQAGRGGAQTTQTAQNSEDCQFLNVYTPDLNASAKRPVMLWLHGGGFRSGNGDAATLDGRNLANFGDVVVITINHRLNLMGYLPIGEYDPEFADAGNCGQLDIIAALRWVKTNIREFGGDPDNVTVWGQSGGGSKIHTLLLMPAADGLYHRAINLSGPTVFELDAEVSWRPLMDEFLDQLGIVDRRNLRRLQEFTPQQLLAAHGAAVRKMGTDDFRPVVDGRNVAFGPLTYQGLRMKANVPMIMGTTETEASIFLRNNANLTLTDEQVRARISAQFGVSDTRAAELMAEYRLNPMNVTPWEVLRGLASDTLFIGTARKAATALAMARQQPVWVYNFKWREPTAGGVWGTPHAFDIPFAYGTTALVGSGIPDTHDASAAECARKAMSAWVAFARTGNPNNPQIPQWDPYNDTTRPTMLMDENFEVVNDFRGVDRRASLPFLDQKTFMLLEGPLFTGNV